ncbi:hypothetical protein SNEBB_009811 [Seison nebaliae]|nr:hypothetical protein SNEBB_009811 [Seison nebaliae]
METRGMLRRRLLVENTSESEAETPVVTAQRMESSVRARRRRNNGDENVGPPRKRLKCLKYLELSDVTRGLPEVNHLTADFIVKRIARTCKNRGLTDESEIVRAAITVFPQAVRSCLDDLMLDTVEELRDKIALMYGKTDHDHVPDRMKQIEWQGWCELPNLIAQVKAILMDQAVADDKEDLLWFWNNPQDKYLQLFYNILPKSVMQIIRSHEPKNIGEVAKKLHAMWDYGSEDDLSSGTPCNQRPKAYVEHELEQKVGSEPVQKRRRLPQKLLEMDLAMFKGVCIICLESDHRSNRCRKPWRCITCNKGHGSHNHDSKTKQYLGRQQRCAKMTDGVGKTENDSLN